MIALCVVAVNWKVLQYYLRKGARLGRALAHKLSTVDTSVGCIGKFNLVEPPIVPILLAVNVSQVESFMKVASLGVAILVSHRMSRQGSVI
jgi:hypothetical protein